MPKLETKQKIVTESTQTSLSWKDSLPAQKILDAICQIIASEYATVAKEHPETFIVKE